VTGSDQTAILDFSNWGCGFRRFMNRKFPGKFFLWLLPVIYLATIIPAMAQTEEPAPAASAPDPLKALMERLENQNGPLKSADDTGAVPLAPTALPQADVAPREPEMALSPEKPLAPVNPFAPPAAVPSTARKSKDQLQAELREQAFNAAVTGLLPLEPNEIRALLERFDQTRQAVEVPIYPAPEPEIAVSTVSLDPGSTPEVLKLATGNVTTLSMLDISGKPWPIQDISFAGDFDVTQPDSGSNMLRITPLSEFAHGNMSMKMVELDTPIMFTLETHRDKVHYRFDARIPEYGPMTEPSLIDGGITMAAGNPVVNSILEGVPPGAAMRLHVTGVDGRTTAYVYNSQTYVRTPLTLLSPGWSSSISSADGMNVYALANTPVLLLSDKGKVVRARLSEEGSEE
jgi:intracellular multiplication protein IcmK